MVFDPSHALRDRLVPLNPWADDATLIIDLAYAQADHPDNHFGQLYHKNADTLWLEINLAKIVIKAALTLKEQNKTLVVLDGLRPIEAQAKMQDQGFPEALVARPGQGGHPRAMAVDVMVMDHEGTPLDMGTAFDFFVTEDDLAQGYNPAARHFSVSPMVTSNRKILDGAMMNAAAFFQLPLLPFPEEWWDFRFPKEISLEEKPLSNDDLYPCQKLMGKDVMSWTGMKDHLPVTISQNINTLRTIFS